MNILLVDDDETLMQFMTQAVQARGNGVTYTALSAEEALSQVVLRDYHLITLDIKMPGASGLDILPLMRNMCPHAVIAIISGHIPEETIENMAGCADVVMDKPISLEKFFDLVDAATQIAANLDRVREMGRAFASVRES